MKAEPTALADDAPHLLLVDDDRRIRSLLSRFLLSEGYRVTTAESAAEARAKLEGLHFDLMILDVMMPGESGFEFARDLRTRSSVAPTTMSANHSSRVSWRCGSATSSSGLAQCRHRSSNRCASANLSSILAAVSSSAATS